ncbi:TIGR01777 family oxidoreductase [Corynebacterium liangguodongii]|uniref:TIGR01777 family protein n=1 Tax=Corynebacterium liangguodongii TaxID=2079535 RepID=A0A2S0WEB2_9CORY|nr:TIGR01777 family oxidoreductase [Corynebacterium liangguodongii]AWB84080.1 TIGR01777 family protein [Corynebacterium liangguodongii]PWC00091.1 TIGR01777 family protein [Corynebacterium liangguodongii]
MSFSASHVVPAPRDEVWRWHSRPGAVVRLTPPFLPMRPVIQAADLCSGTTEFALPAGLRWVARHDTEGFVDGTQFRDRAANAPFRAATGWVHTHRFEEVSPDSTRVSDHVENRVPGAFLHRAFAYRQRQLIEDLRFLSTLPDSPRLTVAVTGARGLVGTALSAQLTTAGHRVIELSHGTARPGARRWDVDNPAADLLRGVDAVVHLAGEPIGGRFTAAKKRRIAGSRVEPTRRLARLAAESGVKAFVSASAIGFYGTDAATPARTESAPRGEGFLAQVCEEWEAASRVDGLRTVNVRTGLVLSGAGGLLPLLRRSAGLDLGARLGDGSTWMSWISLDDLTDIYVRALVDASFTGPLNATAPHPVTSAEFSAALTRLLHRPDVLSVPAFGPAALLGREGAAELAFASQNVVPDELGARGVRFRYPALESALAHELGRERLVDPSRVAP